MGKSEKKRHLDCETCLHVAGLSAKFYIALSYDGQVVKSTFLQSGSCLDLAVCLLRFTGLRASQVSTLRFDVGYFGQIDT